LILVVISENDIQSVFPYVKYECDKLAEKV